MSLESKVVIVTGAAKGQGLSHARLAAERGARVIAADVDEALGRSAVDELVADGLDVAFHALDVSSQDHWDRLAGWVESTYGGVDGLVNNAGISVSNNVLDTTMDIWNKILGVNQVGPYLGMHTIAPIMARAGRGAIVNVASTLGVFASPTAFAYQATKGAVRMMTKSAALSLADSGIRVNTVLPGLVDTDFIARHKTSGALDASVNRIPLRRVGEPHEISQAVLFLLSDEASYITGAELVVDGGLISGSVGSLEPKAGE